MYKTICSILMLFIFSLCTLSAQTTPAKNTPSVNTPPKAVTKPKGTTNNKANSNSDFNSQMLAAVNQLRTSGTTCGGETMPPVKPLVLNVKLEKAAVAHTVYMNETNNFSHQGKNNSWPEDRIKAAGYKWDNVGENIGKGYKDIPAAIAGWKESTGHCKQMMSAEVTELGAAKVGSYWCQKFAKPFVALSNQK
ncbi:MAG: CAP domain-containing protein [Saprospiraceae bacterium]|nr:CAP domain-containing protein [Saprospiraceae bacterium]